jgi:hypothetical protein
LSGLRRVGRNQRPTVLKRGGLAESGLPLEPPDRRTIAAAPAKQARPLVAKLMIHAPSRVGPPNAVISVCVMTTIFGLA